jgi:hypothetical protein
MQSRLPSRQSRAAWRKTRAGCLEEEPRTTPIPKRATTPAIINPSRWPEIITA